MLKFSDFKRGAVIVLSRKRIALAATVLAVIFIFLSINSPAIVGASAVKRELPIYCVKRDNKAVSLTFDAAWGNEDTQQLIDILDKYNIKATFFVVGFWVDKFPESVKALSDAGHEIMNHSNDHAHFSRLSTGEIISNITACNEKIAAVTGVTPTLFRAPYGEYDDNVIKTLKSMGMNTIQWDVDSLDWKDLSAGEITKRVTSKVQSGSIMLFHNAALHTPEALPAIIEYLIANGYSIVPVSELILQGDYTIDHTGRQLPA
jgi:polysaccharide deacetylase family sporulation protein PdaB